MRRKKEQKAVTGEKEGECTAEDLTTVTADWDGHYDTWRLMIGWKDSQEIG